MMSNQEVPQGYKNTKVGVIPKDWDVVKLKDITMIETGKTPLRTNSLFWDNGSISWVTTTEVNNIYIDTPSEKITQFALDTLKMKIMPINTILLAMYGQGKTRGKVALLKVESAINQAFASIKPNSKYSTNFLFNYLDKSYIKIRNLSHGSNQDNLNLDTVKYINIPLPPLKEQQKIADILTTWDDAISQQEKLIKEKEVLKKGLMQKLLSGEVRFDGFSDVWEEVRLGDIGEFKTSSVDKKVYEGEKLIKLLNYMDVYKNKKIDNKYPNFTTVSASDTQIKTNNLLKGDVVFTPSSETPEDIGHSAVILDNLINTLHSYHVIRFRFNTDMDFGFRGYVFNNKKILKEFSRRATGSTRFTLSIKDFNDAVATIPTKLKEQQKIAEVLSGADKEIDLLKNELEERKEQKMGLMQKLLTGEVRVKV